MPFVIEAVGPPLSWREVPAGYQVTPNEVGIVNSPPQPGQVWDASNNRVRDRSSTETLATAKETKKLEMERMFASESSLAEIAQAALDASTAGALRSRVGKLTAKKQQIDTANSQAQVDSVVW